jgi:hypothetical protein
MLHTPVDKGQEASRRDISKPREVINKAPTRESRPESGLINGLLYGFILCCCFANYLDKIRAHTLQRNTSPTGTNRVRHCLQTTVPEAYCVISASAAPPPYRLAVAVRAAWPFTFATQFIVAEINSCSATWQKGQHTDERTCRHTLLPRLPLSLLTEWSLLVETKNRD